MFTGHIHSQILNRKKICANVQALMMPIFTADINTSFQKQLVHVKAAQNV
jgi:hypothetical protein